MSHVSVCFGWEWQETEKKYIEGQMKRLNVEASIKVEKVLGEIYRISGINSVKYELILRCLSNVKPLVSAFAVSNQEDL